MLRFKFILVLSDFLWTFVSKLLKLINPVIIVEIKILPSFLLF